MIRNGIGASCSATRRTKGDSVPEARLLSAFDFFPFCLSLPSARSIIPPRFPSFFSVTSPSRRSPNVNPIAPTSRRRSAGGAAVLVLSLGLLILATPVCGQDAPGKKTDPPPGERTPDLKLIADSGFGFATVRLAVGPGPAPLPTPTQPALDRSLEPLSQTRPDPPPAILRPAPAAPLLVLRPPVPTTAPPGPQASSPAPAPRHPPAKGAAGVRPGPRRPCPSPFCLLTIPSSKPPRA